MHAYLMRTATRALDWLRRGVAAAVVAFYAYMAVAVLVQVLGRYVFNYSIGWASESATFAQVWMVLLAAGIAMQRNLHVAVDAFSARLPRPLLRLTTLIIAAACLWFLWQAVAGSVSLIQVGRVQTSPALGMPMWLAYLALPAGLSYLALELLLALSRGWHAPATQPANASIESGS